MPWGSFSSLLSRLSPHSVGSQSVTLTGLLQPLCCPPDAAGVMAEGTLQLVGTWVGRRPGVDDPYGVVMLLEQVHERTVSCLEFGCLS
jgi:hypothetical protein